jgi:hypothetical protein
VDKRLLRVFWLMILIGDLEQPARSDNKSGDESLRPRQDFKLP